MLFQQTSAPIYWTKQVTHNDKALRVVSGTAGSGGTNAFSTVMAQTVVGNTTISIATMPSHGHPVGGAGNNPLYGTSGSGGVGVGGSFGLSNAFTVDPNGGGGSHNHTVSLNSRSLILKSAVTDWKVHGAAEVLVDLHQASNHISMDCFTRRLVLVEDLELTA